jgi:hypothetical protein
MTEPCMSWKPSRRVTFALLGLIACGRAWSADLSMISDFGKPDLPQEKLGLAPTNASIVGVEQVGNVNRVTVQQAGSSSNNTQVWQSGADLEASLQQQGSNNELRLSQSDARNRAELTQDGLINKMALMQLGTDNSVMGSQLGDGNQVVLVQPGSAAFSFLQQGNMNQIVADMPVGVSVHVDQIGDNLRFSLSPTN